MNIQNNLLKNLLITGASGMLGATLLNYFLNDFNVYATGGSNFNDTKFRYKKFDLQSHSYDELINWANPDIIIHSGALTNSNDCEENPNLAFDVNGLSVQKFLKATNDNVKIIYISTDAVFSSSIHLAKETDFVFPENIYGKSKELGEFFLNSSINRDFSIIRTTIVGLNLNIQKFGFVEWIINTSKQNDELTLFDDVFFTPISIWDLANEIKFLIKTDNINSETLHISGELCTKYEFGKRILEALSIPTDKLVKGSILNFKNRVKRSDDQSLDSGFYKKKYNRRLSDLTQTMSIFKKIYYERNQIRNKNS